MTALNRKLLRDLAAMKGQSLAIVLVMACGVATFVMSLTTLRSLEESQSAYYRQYRFADVFARVKRAPESLRRQIARIPGIAQVQTRIVANVTLDVADLPEPATGRLISVPETDRPVLNDLYLRQGRYIEPGRTGEALVSEGFAHAHRLGPGDSVRAILNGRLQQLKIVGVVLSPEYIISVASGLSLPDDKRFGVFWMGREQLEAAFDMDGAFNDVTAALAPGASEAAVLEALDRLTEPYGGIGAHGRSDQLSNRFVSDEIRSLRGMAMIVPIIFLAVAAFLLNVVMTRLIGTQREQIAALKAFGYSGSEIAGHYVKFVLVIALAGALLGTAGGIALARGMTGMYAVFYHFPTFAFVVSGWIVPAALGVAGGAALLGTLGAVIRAMALPAAEAMRPEPPANFRPTIVERLGMARWFTQPARMVLRQLERRPFKSLLSIAGIAAAVAILVTGRFVTDAIDHMIQFGFYHQQRQDVMVSFFEPRGASALHEIQRLPGVIRAEPRRGVAVRLRHGPIARWAAINGLMPGGQLLRVIDSDMNPIALPSAGLVMSDKLAEVMRLKIGDEVWVQVMEAKRPLRRVPLAAIVKEYAGTNVYMDIRALRRLLEEGDSLNGALLQVDANRYGDLYAALKRTPTISAVSVKAASVRSFRETQGENQRRIQMVNVGFACIIAAGVVYNTARISLSERGRELATLRVIGFTRGEISAILLGELAVLTLAALPLGMLLGYGFAWWAVTAFDSESFRIPLVIGRQTYGFAAAVVIAAAIGSGLLVRRRLDRLDLLSVLKSTE